jgi:acyl-CoA-binding protein
MTDEQLKDLLEIIIERLHFTPNNDYMLKYYYPHQNINHVSLVTVEPITMHFISRNYLKITVYTLSETERSDYKVFKLYDRYNLKTVEKTIKNRNGLYRLQQELKFKEALENTIGGIYND